MLTRLGRGFGGAMSPMQGSALALGALMAVACSRPPAVDVRERTSGMAPVGVVGAPSLPRERTNMQGRTYLRPSDQEIRSRLSALEFEVTQRQATEQPFRNRYWDNHEPGLYVDIVSGEPLFSSRDKFESGTGWPSFSKPVEEGRISTRTDTSHGMSRTEVRSRIADSHLGHVFGDGPQPTGLRYCVNSASLRFVPLSGLENEGYGQYRSVVEGAPQPAMPAANACAVPGPNESPGCQATLETAILAGGCFWGMEELIRKIPGVLETQVGYTGGTTANPTYEDVSSGRTGHAEAVRIVFDPAKLSYEDLLTRWFFRMHDPTTKNRQGHDVGTQYRSAIYATTPEQHRIAEQVNASLASEGRWHGPITTEIADAGPFTAAEEYHQAYLQKHPGGYTCHFLRD